MEVTLRSSDGTVKVMLESGQTIRDTLHRAGMLPSMVIVSFEGTVLPHSTVLHADVELLVTTISSGG